MENLLVKKYFDTLNFIYTKSREIDDTLTEQPLNTIKLIDSLIELNETLNSCNIRTLTKIEEKILLFIKRYNNSEIDDDFKELRTDLELLFNNLMQEYKSNSNIQVKVYFYGEDNYDIAHSKYFKYPLCIIESEEQLKELLSQKATNETNYNILLIDKDLIGENTYFNLVLNSDEVLELLFKACLKLYKIYYDYNYIKNSLLKSYEDDIRNIIVGNSYALLGVDEFLLKDNSAKLALHSQDLYYTTQLAKTAISKNKNIKRCIMSLSYYVVHHDLSKGNSKFSSNLTDNIYYQLLKDRHNSNRKNIKHLVNLNDCSFNSIIKNVFDLIELEEHFNRKIYSQNLHYFSDLISNDRTKEFDKMDDKQKEDNGLIRAASHNKIFKYKETKEEYNIILKEFFDFLSENSVTLVPVVFPTSNYYYKNLTKEYIEEFNELLEYIERIYNVKILDLRDKKYGFDDTHFIDSDHLNRKGEVKATNYINEFIDEIDRNLDKTIYNSTDIQKKSTPIDCIPKGDYCYDKNGTCRFWSLDKNRFTQENGYCSYLSKGDWDFQGTGLLWDMVKECGINTK